MWRWKEAKLHLYYAGFKADLTYKKTLKVEGLSEYSIFYKNILQSNTKWPSLKWNQKNNTNFKFPIKKGIQSTHNIFEEHLYFSNKHNPIKEKGRNGMFKVLSVTHTYWTKNHIYSDGFSSDIQWQIYH